MSAPTERDQGNLRGRDRISSNLLVLFLMVFSLIAVAALSAMLVGSALRSDRQYLDETQRRLLATLESGGLSGLTVAVQESGATLVPAAHPVGIALWRVIGDRRTLLAETWPGLGMALTDDQGNATSPEGQASLNGRRLSLRWIDTTTATQDWRTPYRDVALAIAQPRPTDQIRKTRGILILIWGITLLFLAALVYLSLDHRRRHAAGLDAISDRLDRFAAGETDLRMPADPRTPELRRLHARLDHVMDQLDKLMGGLRHISAHMAHELNSPLQKIRGGLSRVSRASTDEDRQIAINEIETVLDVTRLRLQNLMQLFRLNAGEVATLDDPVDLSDLTESVIEDLESIVNDQDRRCELRLQPGIVVAGNRPLLELMITNLLTNIGKYAPPGSEVCVALTAENDTFRLEVSNTGSCFPPVVRDRAFRRFVRGTDGREATSAGLGLSLIAAIVDAHDFHASLPASDTKAIVEITGACAAPAGGPGAVARVSS
ncbi:sensor histidine kinase [Pseudooceanicola sp. C21-150M6]|uniref:sensor histidine kinase n=1 Tax=Pseudooceanicola sp. C21-150M6 TaxID=3434355 RepID=UPI003D7FC5C3